MKITNVKMIEVSDWDDLVKETYKRDYSFQQQEGSKPDGVSRLTIPSDYTDDDILIVPFWN